MLSFSRCAGCCSPAPTSATEILRHDLLYDCYDRRMSDMLPALVASKSSWDQVTAVKCCALSDREIAVPVLRRAMLSRHVEVKIYATIIATHFRDDFEKSIQQRTESRPELQWARTTFSRWGSPNQSFMSFLNSAPFAWHSAYTYLSYGSPDLKMSATEAEEVAALADDDKQLREQVLAFLKKKFG